MHAAIAYGMALLTHMLPSSWPDPLFLLSFLFLHHEHTAPTAAQLTE
jgi:hypothetical protein